MNDRHEIFWIAAVSSVLLVGAIMLAKVPKPAQPQRCVEQSNTGAKFPEWRDPA